MQARIFGLLAMSTSTHVIVFTALGWMPPPSRVLAMHEAQFEVVTPPPPPPPPKIDPPKPKDPDPPAPKAAHHPAPQPAAAPPPTPSQAPPPVEEVADFTGVTLTGGDGSWSTAVGTGGALKGPVGKIGSHGQNQAPQQAAKIGPIGPRVVALDSLARKPQPPPGLDELLIRYYPRRARMLGVEGNATVAMRILPTGRISNIRLVNEQPADYEFGSACRDMVHAMPPFVAPLDRTGAAVATDATFTCKFEVGSY